MIRRGDQVAAPSKICFPGGAVEIGESPREAVKRELREELNATIEPIALVWEFEIPDRSLRLWGWYAELKNQELTADPNEVADVLWLRPDEVLGHPDILTHTDTFLAVLENAHANAQMNA